MHPLSTFPQLFFLALISPLLLRLGVGVFLLSLGKDRSQKEYNWASVIYILSGLLLILGLFTQISAIIGILILAFDFYSGNKTQISKEKYFLYIITVLVLLSLLFTGPGFFAFDLPL